MMKVSLPLGVDDLISKHVKTELYPIYSHPQPCEVGSIILWMGKEDGRDSNWLKGVMTSGDSVCPVFILGQLCAERFRGTYLHVILCNNPVEVG